MLPPTITAGLRQLQSGNSTEHWLPAVLDIAYVGTIGRHLGQSIDLNALPPGTRFMTANQDPTSPGKPLADNFLRRYIGTGSVPFTEFSGGSTYNALQLSVTRRFTNNL
jgi:hypothetical protein